MFDHCGRTDDGAWVYYKLTYEPSAQVTGELQYDDEDSETKQHMKHSIKSIWTKSPIKRYYNTMYLLIGSTAIPVGISRSSLMITL